VDLINLAKFYRNRLTGLDSVRGQSLTIPIRLRCIAVNTGQDYRPPVIRIGHAICQNIQLNAYYTAAVMIRVRIRFSVWLMSCYAHVFLPL